MLTDRRDAGRLLGAVLADRHPAGTVVLALPRGGVPVAAEVADRLRADLDVLVVRKLGAPGNPEFAMGAIGEGGAIVVDDELRQRLGVTTAALEQRAAAEAVEVERRIRTYRADRAPLSVAGRPVIIVDDGLATGSTAAAAVAVARHLGAARVTVAVPVGAPEAVSWLRSLADEVVCLEAPEDFMAVGAHYVDFTQVTDEEVLGILARQDSPARRTVAP